MLNCHQFYGGTTSTRMYSKTERVKFDLSFRVYAKQALGNSNKMSGYKRAITMLTAYASPVHTLETDNAVEYLASNVGTTIVQATLALTDLVDFTIQTAEGKEELTAKTKLANNILESYRDNNSAATSAWNALKSR